MAAIKLPFLVLLLLSLPATARLAQYTQNHDDNNHIALGFSVPQSVASTSALAGFRDYPSLLARLDLLALQSPALQRHKVGRSRQNRPIYAYRFGHNNDAVMLQAGGMHAREWASPEAVTYIAEQLTQQADSGGLETWLRDHSSIVLLPVLNPDGLLASQTFANQTRVADDPRDSTPSNRQAKYFIPRDGRMRRKNLRQTDGNPNTASDTLLGVDLNRNIQRFFNTGRASSDPQSLVYHGPADASEPEIQALIQASKLFPADSLRLFVDTHSFGRVFFYNHTPNTRLFEISQQLVDGIRLLGTGKDYAQAPEQTGVRVGATDEYFAYNFQVPAYTLEIEPSSKMQAAEYGGNAQVSNSGFILPDAQVPRMRRQIYQMMRLAYYRQAGAAHLQAAELRSLPDNQQVALSQWQDQDQQRRLQVQQNQPLRTGQRYRLLLNFSKPMRWRDEQGTITAYPGQDMPQTPRIRLQSGGQSRELDSSHGQWQDKQYQTDQFRLDFTLPAGLGGDTQLHLQVQDLAGVALDSHPASILGWRDGHWQQWENDSGQAGDVGGGDHNIRFAIAGQPEPPRSGGSGRLSLWLLLAVLPLRLRRKR